MNVRCKYYKGCKRKNCPHKIVHNRITVDMGIQYPLLCNEKALPCAGGMADSVCQIVRSKLKVKNEGGEGCHLFRTGDRGDY